MDLRIWFIVSQCYRIKKNYCKSMEGPRRYRWYKHVCFHIYSMVLEVPELVNFHSNLRPWGTKHTHEHTHRLSTPPRPPAGILWSRECVHLLHLFTFTLIIPTWLTIYLLFHLHHAVFGTTPRFEMFFSCYFLSSLLHFNPPILTVSLSAWLQTHPPIRWTCWHTNTVFRKQNIPGNMTGIWKCSISLGGWVSNPQANEQGREGGRERDCGGTLFILPRPDGEGSFGAARPLSLTGHDTHTTHTQTQLPQFVCTAVLFCFWWPKRVIFLRFFYLSLFRC